MLNHLGSAVALLCLAGVVHPACGQDATLAATPPMGWNSWNHFADRIDAKTMRAQADAMVASGMRDAGYIYVNIDDGWQGKRSTAGEIMPNARFGDMKALADYIHKKGLKLGVYSSPGTKTCAGYEGSYGHEDQDARSYAKWGVDYLKYDLCSYDDMAIKTAATPAEARQRMQDIYEKMHQGLLKTGRPIVYSLCQYGFQSVWRWGPQVGGNAWRTTGDINDSFDRMTEIGFQQAGLARFASPGHWNDPDMLEVGNGGMTTQEYRMHISLWAMLAAPLLAGNDLTKMSPETIALLTNHAVLAIDQDKAGRQGDRVWAQGGVEMWSRSLADGGKAIAVFNRSDRTQPVTFDYHDVGIDSPVQVHDIWQARDMGLRHGKETVEVPGRGVVLLRTNS